MPDIKEAVTRPIGPLPAFAWVLVIVGGYFGYKFLSGRSGSSSSTTAATVGTSVGSVAPSSSDYAALTAGVSTLGNQITDLGSKITTLAPTIPTPVIPPITIPPILAPVLPPVETPMHSQPIAPPSTQPLPIAALQSVIGYIDTATGVLHLSNGLSYNEAVNNATNNNAIRPSLWTDTIGNIIASRDSNTGQILFTGGDTAGTVLNQVPGTEYNYIRGLSSGIDYSAGALPTYSNAPVSGPFMRIPAMTPVN